jgi:hypothetical protein
MELHVLSVVTVEHRDRSIKNSIDVITTTPWLKFMYEHRFAMKISENHCCHVTAMNRASSVPGGAQLRRCSGEPSEEWR